MSRCREVASFGKFGRWWVSGLEDRSEEAGRLLKLGILSLFVGFGFKTQTGKGIQEFVLVGWAVSFRTQLVSERRKVVRS